MFLLNGPICESRAPSVRYNVRRGLDCIFQLLVSSAHFTTLPVTLLNNVRIMTFTVVCYAWFSASIRA